MAVSESQAAASRFEQTVMAQRVAIAPGLLRLRPEDVLAYCAPIGFEIRSWFIPRADALAPMPAVLSKVHSSQLVWITVFNPRGRVRSFHSTAHNKDF